MRWTFLLLVVLAVGALAASANAEPWRLGSPLELSHAGSANQSEAVLSFTPRLPGVFDLDDARVTLTYAPLRSGGRHFGDMTSGEGFAIGGAIALDDVAVRGEIAQTTRGAVERDDVRATIEFGSVTTSMSYAELGGAGGIDSSRYALGADLATAPGVSVGAGLSYGLSDDAGDDDEAAGILRFRLSF